MIKLPAKYYSHGKLLLTGEYLVMFGAESLAVPVNFGQEMIVEEGISGHLTWKAYIQRNEWFTAELELPRMEVKSSSDPEKAGYLVKVLKEAQKINPLFLNFPAGFAVTTRLSYPQKWGLGSSSTFISNIAKWAGIDAMQLNSAVSEGSGYDIACTLAGGPVLYKLNNRIPDWKEVSFLPSFNNHLYFLFLGKKQDTSNSISNFKHAYRFNQRDTDYISGLTRQLLRASTLDTVITVMENHERFVSGLLGIETVQKSFFKDFNGAVKSLGAWGGDFALVASGLNFEDVQKYFHDKGFNPVLKYKEVVFNPNISIANFASESNSELYSGQFGRTID